MASISSSSIDRRGLRRRATIEDALDHAVAIMSVDGVGGLSMSEVARRLGIRQPSLYKYFPSLHAVYDALFARGLARSDAAVMAAVKCRPSGVARIRAGARAWVRWATENQALAQLLVWRPVPGFAPTEAAFAASVDHMRRFRDELSAAVASGELSPDADSDEALRLYTVVLSGLISQQMANEPNATFEGGRFSVLADSALDLFFARYTAERRIPDADARP